MKGYDLSCLSIGLMMIIQSANSQVPPPYRPFVEHEAKKCFQNSEDYLQFENKWGCEGMVCFEGKIVFDTDVRFQDDCDPEFKGDVVFNGPASFNSNAAFEGNVTFHGPVEFQPDSNSVFAGQSATFDDVVSSDPNASILFNCVTKFKKNPQFHGPVIYH